MWVRILKDRDFTPTDNRRVTVAYRQGTELPVKRAWGEALIADGDAEEIPSPGRSDAGADGAAPLVASAAVARRPRAARRKA